jgi:Flp pilus assembly protein TadB
MGAGLLVSLAFFVILASIAFRLPLWQPLMIAIVAAAILFWLVPRMKRTPGK